MYKDDPTENTMNTPTQTQMQTAINAAEDTLPPFSVTIVRNIMLEPLETILKYFFIQEKHRASVTFGGYDTMQQEALGLEAESLFTEARIVLLFTFLPRLSPLFANSFASLSPQAIKEEEQRILESLENLLTGIRQQTSAPIIWHGLERPVFPALGIADGNPYPDGNGQCAAISRINHSMRNILNHIGNAFYTDTDICLMRAGAEKFYDPRLWHMARMPYSWEGLYALALESMKNIRPLLGRVRKCLVLDCDNTLWHGIIGEDGLSGIRMDDSYPGSCHRELQQTAIDLYHRGVILALCSKNNEEDVWEVFDSHQDMLLQRAHLASYRINWNNKVDNLRELAQELNIGLDSFVFVDDSSFEVSMVEECLPEVCSIHLSSQHLLQPRKLLLESGLFDSPVLSAEDRERGKMYQAESHRKQLQSKVTDLATYYKSLEMVIRIDKADHFSIPRIAQQTQKTNQFNLTTHRYTETQLEEMTKQKDCDVLCLSVSDRFGDLGIVGTCILRYTDSIAFFDTFLLSCRVLGRRIEDVFLGHALRVAKKNNAKSAIGCYKRTAKNHQVEDFFEKRNFVEIKKESGTDGTWKFDLDKEIASDPDFFKKIQITY